MVITLIIIIFIYKYIQFSFSIAAFWQHYAHCASIGGRRGEDTIYFEIYPLAPFQNQIYEKGI